MAVEDRGNVEEFLRNIPTQLAEARRNFYSDNTNVLEFTQRRLEDIMSVLNVLVRRCSDLQIHECMDPLRHLITEVQQIHGQYDDLTSHSRIQNEHSFSCPRESNIRGRPRYAISNELISGLQQIHRSWQQVSANIGVSYRTLLRRRHENGMIVNRTSGPRRSYSNINNNQLCQQVSTFFRFCPMQAKPLCWGHCDSEGFMCKGIGCEKQFSWLTLLVEQCGGQLLF